MRRVFYYFSICLSMGLFNSFIITLSEIVCLQKDYDLLGFFRHIIGSTFYLLFVFLPFSFLFFSFILSFFILNEKRKYKTTLATIYSLLIGTMVIIISGILISFFNRETLSYGLPLNDYVYRFFISSLLYCFFLIPIHNYFRKKFDFLNEAE